MNFSRKAKLQSNFAVLTLIVVGLVLILNVLGYQWFYRWDLTKNQKFSLAPATKTILKNLDDVVNVKVYFSEKLPPQYLETAQGVKDVLVEYQNFSHGQIKITYIDPKDDTVLQAEANNLGIPSVRFNIMERDQFQVSQGFLGLAVVYGDKKEVLPVIEDVNNLEYKLTAAVKKVTTNKINRIGFVQGHGETPIDESAPGKRNLIKEFLSQQFEVVAVDTKNGDEINDNINTLVVAGPKDALADRELYVIDQFLMKGKSVLFLLDGVVIDDGLNARQNNSNVEKLLANYGINLDKNLVLDASNDFVSFNDGRSTFFVLYPFWVKALKNNFDKNSVLVNQLETVLLPWTSSLNINKDIVGNNQISELIKSSDKSLVQSDKFNLDPTQQFIEQFSTATNLQQYLLAVAVNGKFNSYFKGKSTPAKDIPTVDKSPQIQSASVIDSTDKGRIIVVGDSDFISEGLVGRSQNNLVFFQNLLDGLSQDQDLIAIRSKGLSDYPIKEVADSQKTTIRFINIFGVTILLAVLGGVRFFIRRRAKVALV